METESAGVSQEKAKVSVAVDGVMCIHLRQKGGIIWNVLLFLRRDRVRFSLIAINLFCKRASLLSRINPHNMYSSI